MTSRLDKAWKYTLTSVLAAPSFRLSAAHGAISEAPRRCSGWQGLRMTWEKDREDFIWILFGSFGYYSYFCHSKTWVRLCTSFVFRRHKNLKPSNALIASLLWLCVRKRSFVCNINFKNSCWVLCLQKTVWWVVYPDRCWAPGGAFRWAALGNPRSLSVTSGLDQR